MTLAEKEQSMTSGPPSKRYRMHEAELLMPVAWQDQSMQLFRIPSGAGGGDASFIVTRDYDAGGTPANVYASEQVKALKQKFQGFKLWRFRVVSGSRAKLKPAAVEVYR
jgi:hypothetical protein